MNLGLGFGALVFSKNICAYLSMAFARTGTFLHLGIQFCRKISNAQFDSHKLEFSQSSLLQLAQTVVINPDIGFQSKIDFLNKFKHEYPELYLRIKW